MHNYATWELRCIIKALSMCSLLNSAEDNARLAMAKQELRKRRMKA